MLQQGLHVKGLKAFSPGRQRQYSQYIILIPRELMGHAHSRRMRAAG